MKITSAEFLISNSDHRKCPTADKPEFAFIGRSNVGKSSLINMLVSKKDLAKTSSQPGKTQLINHFIINKDWYLVDLPGYGYARASKSSRKTWSKMIQNYILKRENLLTLFVLIDSRLAAQKIDIEFINYLGEKYIPFVLIFTKADKQSQRETSKNIENFKVSLLEYWEDLPIYFISSAKTKLGSEEILNEIERILPYFEPTKQ